VVFLCKTRVYRLSEISSSPIIYDPKLYRVRTRSGHQNLESLFVSSPNNYNERIYRQAAVFHCCNKTNFSAIDYGIDYLRIKIPAKSKPHLLQVLEACNINKLTLGLTTPDSVAKDLNKELIT